MIISKNIDVINCIKKGKIVTIRIYHDLSTVVHHLRDLCTLRSRNSFFWDKICNNYKKKELTIMCPRRNDLKYIQMKFALIEAKIILQLNRCLNSEFWGKIQITEQRKGKMSGSSLLFLRQKMWIISMKNFSMLFCTYFFDQMHKLLMWWLFAFICFFFMFLRFYVAFGSRNFTP